MMRQERVECMIVYHDDAAHLLLPLFCPIRRYGLDVMSTVGLLFSRACDRAQQRF